MKQHKCCDRPLDASNALVSHTPSHVDKTALSLRLDIDALRRRVIAGDELVHKNFCCKKLASISLHRRTHIMNMAKSISACIRCRSTPRLSLLVTDLFSTEPLSSPPS